MAQNNVGINARNFEKLVRMSKVTISDVSKGTGISTASIENYTRGITTRCSIENILRICRFFGCSSDYLLGLTNDAESSEIFRAFSQNRQEYLSWVLDGHSLKMEQLIERNKSSFGVQYKTVTVIWPYNLIADIETLPWERKGARECGISVPLTKDQIKGLEKALEFLTERERRAVEFYYLDGKTLEETGKEFGVTRERVRQLLAKAVRKLRSPAVRPMIVYGYRGCGLPQREKRLEKKERELASREKAIAGIQEMEKKVGTLSEKAADLVKKLDAAKTDLESRIVKVDSRVSNPGISLETVFSEAQIDDLDLSVRSYNCLKRAGIGNMLDLVVYVAEHRADSPTPLSHIRNLGKRSIDEIDQTLIEKAGFSISDITAAANRIGYSGKGKGVSALVAELKT